MELKLFFLPIASIIQTVSSFPTPPLLFPHTSTIATTTIATRHVTKDPDHAVAFSVGLTHTQHVMGSDRIIYDKVFVNKGNAYDKNSGIFICPISGLYVFHIHAYDSNTDKAMWLELLHNNNVTISVSGYNSHTSGGNSVMLQVNKYDRIEVKGRDRQSFSLFGLPDQIYSTFTGYLLVPMSVVRQNVAPVLIG